MSASRSIVIVGAGIIGLCTAWYCARRGHHVTLLDVRAPDGDCCSRGNAGLVCPSHFIPLASPGMVRTGLRMMANPRSPFYIKPRLDADLLHWAWKFAAACTPRHVQRSAPLLRDLNIASRDAFVELQNELNFKLHRRGLLMLCRTEQGFAHEREFAERAHALGLAADILSPAEAAALEPNIRMNIAGAVHFLDDAHLTPSPIITSLQQRCEREGVAFRWNEPVVEWETRDTRIQSARTHSTRVSADEFIIAGGAWSAALAKQLGVRLPMQGGKGYSLTLPRPVQSPTIASILTEARLAVTPMEGGLRFAGTMEIAGLNQEINPERIAGIIESIPHYYPDFSAEDFSDIKPWAGLRPVSADGLPYVGRSRRWKNLSIATGHAMLGLSLGPITGKLLSQVISGEAPSIDIRQLSPDRYS